MYDQGFGIDQNPGVVIDVDVVCRHRMQIAELLESWAVQFFVNGSRLPDVRDRVGISVGVLGAVLMIGNAVIAARCLFTDHVIARMTSRRVMVVGGLLYVAALPIIGWSTSSGVLVVGLIVLMWFDVLIDVSMNLHASSVVNRSRFRP